MSTLQGPINPTFEMRSNQSTFANTTTGQRQSIVRATQMEQVLGDFNTSSKEDLARRGSAGPTLSHPSEPEATVYTSGSSLYTHGVASSPGLTTVGYDTKIGDSFSMPSELNTIPETQGRATLASALPTGTTSTAVTQVACTDACLPNERFVSTRVKQSFGQKLRDLLSPKGLALFNKEMPAAPGFGCKNAHPQTKKLRRSETKHAEHFQATKKWSKWLCKFRRLKFHNACYVQRIPVCGQSECPVAGHKVHRLGASRTVCKFRVFASRAGFMSVDTDLVNLLRPAYARETGTYKSTRLDSELLDEERVLAKYRTMLPGDFKEHISVPKSIHVDNGTFAGPLTWMKNKNFLVQEAGTGGQATVRSDTPTVAPSLFDSGKIYLNKDTPTLPFVATVENTPLLLAPIPQRPVIAANLISPESTLRNSTTGHGDRVIEEIETVIGKIDQGFPKKLSIKEPTKSCGSAATVGQRLGKYGPATINRKLGDVIGVALRPDATKQAQNCTENVGASTESADCVVESIKSQPIVKTLVPALPVKTESGLDSWLPKPKSQLWAALQMETLLIPHLDGKFEFRFLSVDSKLLCKSKTETILDEYLQSLQVEMCVEVQQETVRFETSATLGSGAKPKERAPTLGSRQIAHLQGLIRGQDDLMRLHKKKFLAQFGIHDRIEAYILALLENLQATGEVFVKICTDLANSAHILADYEYRLSKLKNDFDLMSQMEQSASESISKIEAGFTKGLIEVIRQHAETCNIKELYQQQFHNIWVHTLDHKALTSSEADRLIGCLNVDSQRGFLDKCIDLEAYSVLSQKFDRIKAVYKEVSRARADFMKVYTDLSSRLSAHNDKSHGGKATP